MQISSGTPWRVLLLFAALAPFLASGAEGQQDGGGGQSAGDAGGRFTHEAPHARAIRSAGAITVDARFDEPIWAQTPVIRDFTQLDPAEGEPISERTEVRIAYDDAAIYFAATMYDTGPLTTRLARRDTDLSDSDYFEVTLDSYHDHQTAYRFTVNPSGVRGDAVISGVGGRGGGVDRSWDPVWEVATAVTGEGWVVEMRIPFSQLRFSREEHQVWGIQIERSIHRKQEQAIFAFTPKLERGGVSRFGHLEGLSNIRPSGRLELLPYVSARAEYRQVALAQEVGFVNPFRSGSDYFTNAGLDLKFGITSNLTLDATVNPDFGQVEVDPAVINLTAFETRYEEKRPFFIEGADIFRFAEGGPVGSTGRPPQPLYSRRIGRAPQLAVPSDAVFAQVPSTTMILGAAKLTGKTAGGWSIGLLEAITGRETALLIDRFGNRSETPVEPLTNYFVGRVRRDLRGGQTRIGVIAAAANRRLDDPSLERNLRASAYAAGFDFVHEWSNRAWRFSGAFAPSYVTGSPESMIRTQRASSRYFQRPDAPHLRVDSTATSLAGYYAMADLDKQAGAYQMSVAVGATSPGYEPNDLGFQTTADRFILDTIFVYDHTVPGRFFRRWDLRGGPDAIWNFAGDMVFGEFNLTSNFTFSNYWGGNVRIGVNPEVTNDRLTRGGPRSIDPQGYYTSFLATSDNRKSYVGRFAYEWATDVGGSWSHTANLNLSYRPGSSWDLRVGPAFTRRHAVAQYVAAVADPLAVEMDRRRYIFAGLDQTTLGLETRVDVTFTPALSFQMYAQPFFSSGDYGALKELLRPGAFDFSVYGVDRGTIERGEDRYFYVDPDAGGPAQRFRVEDLSFNYRSLIGNAVVRWEWHRGSTVYFVWQQGRADRITGMRQDPGIERVGRFALNRDLRDLVHLQPENILQIKFNYWLNP